MLCRSKIFLKLKINRTVDCKLVLVRGEGLL